MTIIATTIVLPAVWASALVNGDFSGLDEDEAKQALAKIEELAQAGYYVVDVIRDDNGEPAEPFFSHHYKHYNPSSQCECGEVLDYAAHLYIGE